MFFFFIIWYLIYHFNEGFYFLSPIELQNHKFDDKLKHYLLAKLDIRIKSQ
jgi:hypothetical protein